MSETEILPTEPLTVVLSKKGWVRAAKGHEIDVTALNYRAGDTFGSLAKGRSNQPALFIDSTGRSYGIPAHTLPSARGQGEPLTGKLNPPANAEFIGVVMGENEQQVLLASEAGYGFITKLEELFTKNRNGKAMLSVPNGAKPLQPRMLVNLETDLIAAATNTGHLLIIAAKDLPVLAKGKGNKILNIPGKRVITREEYLADIVVLQSDQVLIVSSKGKKDFKLKPADWQHFVGERTQRGMKLPRAYQHVESLSTGILE